MKKEDILNQIFAALPVEERNIMGCNESWYNPYYAIKHTFDEKYIRSMSEKELNDLYKLADMLSEAFY